MKALRLSVKGPSFLLMSSHFEMFSSRPTPLHATEKFSTSEPTIEQGPPRVTSSRNPVLIIIIIILLLFFYYRNADDDDPRYSKTSAAFLIVLTEHILTSNVKTSGALHYHLSEASFFINSF